MPTMGVVFAETSFTLHILSCNVLCLWNQKILINGYNWYSKLWRDQWTGTASDGGEITHVYPTKKYLYIQDDTDREAIITPFNE